MLPVGLIVWLPLGALLLYVIRLIKPFVLACIARRQGKLPPGPPSYPIIGTPGMVDDEPWHLITAWTDKYGKDGMISFFLGPQLQVVLSDGELARNVFKDPRMDGRAPNNQLHKILQHGGVASSEGTLWKDSRKFEIMALKDFGRASGGNNLMEEYIQQAAADLVTDMQRGALSGAFNPRPANLKCVSNSISSTLCGTALRDDDPRYDRITENMRIVFTEGTTPNSPLNVFPWLAVFPPFRQQQAKLHAAMNDSIDIMQEIIDDHRKHFDPENVRDFMDAYLEEQSRHVAEGSKSSFTDKQLVIMSIEMYFAGLDAALSIMQWAVLLLASTPEVQQRCQEEVDRVLGGGKMASYADRTLLPYCEATVNEISRIATADPFGVPHRVLEDTPILSYTIPKDALVFVNYTAIHFSEKNFKDPFSFRPDRFIDEHCKFQANPNNLPFAAGRRMCSGDNFAKMILFISIVSLVQHFTFKRADSKPWTKIKRINGVGVHPEAFEVTATIR